jgi:hypothetical protein
MINKKINKKFDGQIWNDGFKQKWKGNNLNELWGKELKNYLSENNDELKIIRKKWKYEIWFLKVFMGILWN